VPCKGLFGFIPSALHHALSAAPAIGVLALVQSRLGYRGKASDIRCVSRRGICIARGLPTKTRWRYVADLATYAGARGTPRPEGSRPSRQSVGGNLDEVFSRTLRDALGPWISAQFTNPAEPRCTHRRKFRAELVLCAPIEVWFRCLGQPEST
jgi:hypothetical protein